MLWTCSRDGQSGMLQGHWHWVDCRRAAFVRFWVADRSDSWSVPAFGAKWIIGGRQPSNVADYFPNAKDATRRAAGPSGHARGPAALPFLVGWQGEVAVRWASGPQPACTPGADGGRYVTLWTLRDDGGTAARGPPRGPAAAPPSDPGPRGDAKRLLVRTGFWRQMDNQRTAKSSMREAGLHHKCILMAQSATCASVRRLSWHTHN